MDGFLSSVVAGLLGAIFVSLLGWGRQRLREAKLRRQYPVHGRYATKFEDVVQGNRLMVKAEARIFQKGLKVWGYTFNLHDGRRWEFSGVTSTTGRLQATYRAESPHDTGFGGFYLEMVGIGMLDGMWAGFDSQNKAVTSGRYTFRRLHPVEIRTMQNGEIQEVLAILGDQLGQRYIRERDVLRYIHEPKSLAMVATDSSGIVGALLGEVCGRDTWLETVPPDMRDQVSHHTDALSFHTLGYVRSIAVRSDAHGAGIGSQLVEFVSNDMFKIGATCLVTTGWRSSRGCHIEGIVAPLGFEQICEIADYWSQDSLDRDYECPECGSPCRCHACIFVARKSGALQAVHAASRS